MRHFGVSRILALHILVAVLLVVFPRPALADAPAIKATPLEYQDRLTPGHIKTGYVEVSNPGDSPLTIGTAVQGFRQTGTDGRLEFFDAPNLTTGIKVDLGSFDLGPREAVRVGFTVDPAKLPAGGVYAAIFFRTLPPDQAPNSSYVTESANIGTLLELTNGPAGPRSGTVSAHVTFWQLGTGLVGSLSYHNTETSSQAVGTRPNLTVSVLPWASAPKLKTALVLPGSTRVFPIARPGGFFGLLPLTITDTDTHRSVTSWVFACTGWCQWALLVFLIIMILILPANVLKVFRRRPKSLVRRSLDGLSAKR